MTSLGIINDIIGIIIRVVDNQSFHVVEEELVEKLCVFFNQIFVPCYILLALRFVPEEV